jgi:hypothetical protein
MYSAGILPYAIVNGTLHFLLGVDSKEGSYSDFGGRCEKGDDEEPVHTATREFYEETCGAVLDPRDLNMEDAILITSRTLSKCPYYMYLVHIPWSPQYSTYFLKISDFIRVLNPAKKYCEKAYICWVAEEMVINMNLRSIFRYTYVKHKMEILSAIIGHSGKMGMPLALSNS